LRLLVAHYRHDANTPPQNGTQLGVTELVNGAVIVDRRVDHFEGLNAQGIPTARGESEWTATQVMRVLERLDPFEAAA
jgi:hypothetical protein